MDIRLKDLGRVGTGLMRPECVMATRAGDLFVPDKRGGVAHIAPDGAVALLLAQDAPEGFLPSGIALQRDRSFLIANLGPLGGVWHLQRSGRLRPVLQEVDGRPLPPTNFVGLDVQGRTWVTVSTLLVPREQAMRRDHADGFIVLIDRGAARIVAEGIGFTNEAVADAEGRFPWVNETIGRRTSRFPILADGSLGPKQVVAEYGPATFPDGLALDEAGGVWIVSVSSNRVIHTDAAGRQRTVLEDADPAEMAAVEQAFQTDRFGRAEMDLGGRRELANLSGISFAGPDRRTALLGSLFGTALRSFPGSFPAPVAGVAPVHWKW